MVHAFAFTRDNRGEDYFVWDTEGGSLFNIDFPVFLLLKNEYKTDLEPTECEKAEYDKLSLEIKREAREEIEELKNDGYLFVSDKGFQYKGKRTDIKALCLHICHDCNLKCKYCFASEGTYNTDRDYMSEEVAKKAIDFLVSHSGNRRSLEVDFFGGEPLLNLDVVKSCVNYAREIEKTTDKEFNFTMTTNCVLLDEEICEYLNKEMVNVVLSIDGRKCVHDYTRITSNGTGSYEAVLEGARLMRKIRGDKQYYVRGTFTHNNLDFSKDVESLSDMGFDQISVEPVVLDDEHPLALKKEDYPAIIKEYDKLANLYLNRKGTDKAFNFFHFMIDLKHGPCLNKRLTGCGAGAEYLAVSPVGDVYPCHQFVGETDYRMGSVLDGTFNRDIQNTFAGIDVTKKPECKDCFAKYYCSGGCIAASHHYMGDLKKPYDRSCELMRKRYELSMAIYAYEEAEKDD